MLLSFVSIFESWTGRTSFDELSLFIKDRFDWDLINVKLDRGGRFIFNKLIWELLWAPSVFFNSSLFKSFVELELRFCKKNLRRDFDFEIAFGQSTWFDSEL